MISSLGFFNVWWEKFFHKNSPQRKYDFQNPDSSVKIRHKIKKLILPNTNSLI